MTERLMIHCAKMPDDILDVEVIDGFVFLTVGDDEACTALNRQSAQELRDLLDEFLADDQR